ncbi:hypothetical protein BDV27DRAFT_119208 [Aspergillus caelatus]|uniref:Uncharacterized protein n=1 Tax=Aspergillus caelatus TaxID=61420 RepID=A0A5N7ANT5_9EURO|nr:uncharacterized protein BDV27DRAFT_119208 [Aspergillus caelatus]KAE8370956.1 hypothetical protein BDV27DRAFT_119208 [Aspergillus caelatus]
MLTLLQVLRLAPHHMKSKQLPLGFIFLIASVSGYFGGTEVTAYVASNHGVVELS